MTIRCPYCGNSHIAKHGKRLTAKGERIQMYQCQSCGKFFTDKNKLEVE